MSSSKRMTGLTRLGVSYGVAAAVLVLLIACELIVTLGDGMPWGGDEALYVMHAQNIADGLPYSPTRYVPNPRNLTQPAAYPPGLPLLLASVYSASGLDWADFKIAGIVAFSLFLLVFALIARLWLPPLLAWAAVALIGLHPYVWQIKESVPSEFPFLLFAYASVLLLDRAERSEVARRAGLWVAAGVFAACAYLTRSVGIVLFPALALTGWYQSRKLINPGVLAAVLGFVLAWLVQQVYKPDIGTYLGYFEGYGIQTIWNNLMRFEIGFRYFLEDHEYPQRAQSMLLVLTITLAIAGLVVRIRERMSAFEFFLLGYGALLLIYPVNLEPDRYSFPLWPLILLYMLVGARWLAGFLSARLRYAVAGALVAVLAVNFAFEYADLARQPAPRSAIDADSQALYDFVKRNVPAQELLIARKPTVMALFTGHRASIWPRDCSDADFIAYARSIDARYVVQDIGRFTLDNGPNDPLEGLVERNPNSVLTRIYGNSSFNLYRLP